MKRVLVTGGAGFLGSHVVEHLLKRGHRVVVLDDLSGGDLKNLPNGGMHPGLSFHLGDVSVTHVVDSLFDAYNGFDVVYHLAAYAAENLSHFIRKFNYTNNVIGSVNIVNNCIRHKVRRLVFTSSIAVYGTPVELPVREYTQCAPCDPYGTAKLAVEYDIKAAHEMFGLEYTIFRPHNIIGPKQNMGDKYRNVAAIFINQVRQGKPMTVFGDGLQTRAFSDVDDVAPHIANSAFMDSCANTTINIGADTVHTVLDVAKAVGQAFGTYYDVVHLPARKEVKHIHAHHGLAHHLFGIDITKLIPLETSIEKMVRWAETVGVKETPPFAALELQEGLPEGWK